MKSRTVAGFLSTAVQNEAGNEIKNCHELFFNKD